MLDEGLNPRGPGPHLVEPSGHSGVNRNVTWRPRCKVTPVQYLYIDFELSSWHLIDRDNACVTGIFGQIKDVPQLNSLSVDIYQLGCSIMDVIKVSHISSITMLAYLSRAAGPLCRYPIRTTHDETESERSPQCYRSICRIRASGFIA